MQGNLNREAGSIPSVGNGGEAHTELEGVYPRDCLRFDIYMIGISSVLNIFITMILYDGS
jgi:hypothetical protein